MVSVGNIISTVWCMYDDGKSEYQIIEYLQQQQAVITDEEQLIQVLTSVVYQTPELLIELLRITVDFTQVANPVPKVTRPANPYAKTNFPKTYRYGTSKINE